MSKNVILSEIKKGKIFKIGDVEFIKFFDENGETVAITKDLIFFSRFGNNNDLRNSDILKRLNEEFLPKLAEAIGEENICTIKTDLTTIDGLKPYETMESKVSLPTLDFYRANVAIFDEYKVDNWWWLATPESAQPHSAPDWIFCVAPSGYVRHSGNFYSSGGVRPFLRFVSSIYVSCED